MNKEKWISLLLISAMLASYLPAPTLTAATKTTITVYQLTTQESDYPTQVMLHLFIEEQVEAENSVSEIVAQLKRIGDDVPPILMLDHRLGQRAGE